jgi:hypothetical protein
MEFKLCISVSSSELAPRPIMNMQTIYLPMIIFQVFLKEMPINKFANGCGQYLVLVKEDWEK